LTNYREHKEGVLVMKEILKYLNDPVYNEDIQSLNKSLDPQINQGFRVIQEELGGTIHERTDLQPLVDDDDNSEKIPGTIWLTKNGYIDYEGNEIKAEIPYYVLLSSDITPLNKTEYVRVQPISSFTIFAGPEDILIDDESITGFKFIIETWNEQPIALNLLDKYIGKYDQKLAYRDSTLKISDDLKTFRKYEIRNTQYLRNSITSYLSLEENTQDSNGRVVFNYGNTPVYSSFSQISEPSADYLAAAKISIGGQQQSCTYEQKIGKHKISIEVIKYDTLFTLVIKSHIGGVELINEEKDVLEAASLDGSLKEAVYRDLKAGSYVVRDSETNDSIRIRL